MGKKEDLEKLILDSYQIMYKNNQKISVADPKERSRLRQENDEIWDYIKEFLSDYTSLCEVRRLVASDDIIDIAATRYPDIFARLEAASAQSSTLSNSSPFSSSEDTGKIPIVAPKSPTSSNASLFQMDYKFVHPFVHNDKEEVAQFALSFHSKATVSSSVFMNLIKHICLVLDVSGSMQQPDKYPYLLEAIPRVVDSLADQDRLTIVLFSTESELIWSMDVASSRLQANTLRRKIEQSSIKFNGTFLAPGLRIALDQIQRFHQSVPQVIDRLYILTDGQLHDATECTLLNPELRRLEIEANSFGFGQDFAEATMRQIMEGCPGGRVKRIADTDTLLGEFYHIGEVARNIIATSAELELEFLQTTTPGDAFRYEPGKSLIGTADDRTKKFQVSLGPLEKERRYTYAFETRVYPFSGQQEKLAIATLKYIVEGSKYTLTQDILLHRSREHMQIKQINNETETSFLILEELRTTNPAILIASLQARLKLIEKDGKNVAQIALLKRVIAKLELEQTAAVITEEEIRYIRSDDSTANLKSLLD